MARTPTTRAQTLPQAAGAIEPVAYDWLKSLVIAIGLIIGVAAGASHWDTRFGPAFKRPGTPEFKRVADWHAVLTDPKLRKLPELARLQVVNDYLNRMRFVNGTKQSGKSDYWATPEEFVASDGGDVQDFVVAKYVSLRELGIPDEKLFIMHVKEQQRYNRSHLVLAYAESPDAEPLILDNLQRSIEPASYRGDLAPVFRSRVSDLLLARARSGRTPAIAF